MSQYLIVIAAATLAAITSAIAVFRSRSRLSRSLFALVSLLATGIWLVYFSNVNATGQSGIDGEAASYAVSVACVIAAIAAYRRICRGG